MPGMGTMLVTGGAGFIGSNFVRFVLGNSDDHVVVLDKLTYAGCLESLDDVRESPRFTFVQGDIVDETLVARLFDEHEIETVVNFAAESHVDRSIDTPRPFIDTNIVGAFVLLDAARRRYDKLAGSARERFRFLHVSTDEVYGSLGADGLFSETTPYAPNSPYAASKAAADHLVRSYHHTFGLPVLVTNCSNNYGPYQFPEKLIPLMILNALDGRPLPIYGDGLNVRDWLYVEDHCEGILLVLRKGTLGRHYNIGGSNERTNLNVVDTLCSVLERYHPGADNPALSNAGVETYAQLKKFVEDRKGHDRRYAIDATRIREELGWSPRHDVDSGMEATVRWYLDNREWCLHVQDQGRYSRERLGLKEKDR
jgi:dTDP-glucose 4,6-dehydratase